MLTQSIPLGLCGCGCGAATAIVTRSNPKRGEVLGQPRRFLMGHHSKVDPHRGYQVDPVTGCWNWTGDVDKNGYGRIGRKVVHILLHEEKFGPIAKGLERDHLCRNRRCVNPDHLEAVTRAENVRRGRVARLNTAAVSAIRSELAAGDTQLVVAQRHSVSRGAVQAIANRQTWKEVA